MSSPWCLTYWVGWFGYEPSALESCVVTGVTVSSSDQSGLPALRSALILKFAKFVIPKAMRLIRLMRLFIDSVGPLVTKDLCPVISIGPGSHHASHARFSQVAGPRVVVGYR